MATSPRILAPPRTFPAYQCLWCGEIASGRVDPATQRLRYAAYEVDDQLVFCDIYGLTGIVLHHGPVERLTVEWPA